MDTDGHEMSRSGGGGKEGGKGGSGLFECGIAEGGTIIKRARENSIPRSAQTVEAPQQRLNESAARGDDDGERGRGQEACFLRRAPAFRTTCRRWATAAETSCGG
ncbi:hypothetical protein HPB50_001698 [Hyalomma asiaticum]|uniref:Uncharacterized protein n=1 Tax=Hyalomma asiaticum TaxID=266040 RepID=A0ACB7SSH4_HYAAI|nr:hypothetical protein HPB50_001698 [Hyalomma asiaticum]